MENKREAKMSSMRTMLYCLIPMLLLAGLLLTNPEPSIPRLALGGLLILACPLAHILIMLVMFRGFHGGNRNSNAIDSSSKNVSPGSCH